MPRLLHLSLTAGLLAACADPPSPTGLDPDDGVEARGKDQRIKEQVIAALCTDRRENLVEALAPLVAKARERDGDARRVWDVADQAECIQAPAA